MYYVSSSWIGEIQWFVLVDWFVFSPPIPFSEEIPVAVTGVCILHGALPMTTMTDGSSSSENSLDINH